VTIWEGLLKMFFGQDKVCHLIITTLPTRASINSKNNNINET